MATVEYGVRPSSDEELRSRYRDKIVAAAKQGTPLTTQTTPEDLASAFTPDEIEALERLVENAQLDRREREVRIEARRDIRRMAEQIIREQDAERWQKAEAEARERLGIDHG